MTPEERADLLAGYALGRRFRSDEFGMSGFEVDQLSEEPVVLTVADLRAVEHVVAVVVFANLLAEAFDLYSDSAHQRILPPRAAGVKQSFDLSQEIQFSSGLKIHLWAGVS